MSVSEVLFLNSVVGRFKQRTKRGKRMSFSKGIFVPVEELFCDTACSLYIECIVICYMHIAYSDIVLLLNI